MEFLLFIFVAFFLLAVVGLGLAGLALILVVALIVVVPIAIWREKEAPPRSGWKPEYSDLARFNSEVARGITHDPEYVERMRLLQEEYDQSPVMKDLT